MFLFCSVVLGQSPPLSTGMSHTRRLATGPQWPGLSSRPLESELLRTHYIHQRPRGRAYLSPSNEGGSYRIPHEACPPSRFVASYSLSDFFVLFFFVLDYRKVSGTYSAGLKKKPNASLGL